jgi:hypothetical protein
VRLDTLMDTYVLGLVALIGWKASLSRDASFWQ